MVAFASIFLSLVLGVQPVELLVAEPVALVEVLLDGRRVAELTGDPWSLECDFGDALTPHVLVAIAYDEERREIGRARQWINLPRSSAEVTLILEREGPKTYALLSWESVVAENPTSVEVSLDGVALPVSDPRRIELPEFDPEQLHFLRAELDFPENVSTATEITFGGSFVGATRSELTAIPVRLESGRKLPPIAELEGLFLKSGKPLEVVATEEGPARIFVVRADRAQESVVALGNSLATRRSRRLGAGFEGVAGRPHPTLRHEIPLPKNQRVHFLWPAPNLGRKPESGIEVFDFSPPYTREHGGFYWLLSAVQPPDTLASEERLVDGVAIAGVVAARHNRRRAVILVADPTSADSSHLGAELVRGYLAALMVPLYVWSPGSSEESADTLWPGSRDISSLTKLERAVKELQKQLARQRIVWVDGIHLPQDIELLPRSEPKFSLVR